MSRNGIAWIEGAHKVGGDWFGDGSDGDVVISTDTSLPVAEDTGYIFKQYNNLTINSGKTLTASNRCNAMVLLVKGNLTVNGTISMNKLTSFINDGQATTLAEPHINLLRHGYYVLKSAYPTGGDGGNGRDDPYDHSMGGTGGTGHSEGGGIGGGGGAYFYNGFSEYTNGANGDRPPHGTTFPIVPYWEDPEGTTVYGAGGSVTESGGGFDYGGSGPGGSGAYQKSSTSWSHGFNGDAYGGGAIYIIVGGNIVIGSSGKISANGGNGGGVSNQNVCGGGGGGGGIICITHRGTLTNGGTIESAGGNGGQSYISRYAGDPGSNGTVFIRSYAQLPK